MANKEHLDILRQGVETWNDWRENNKNIRPNLGKAHLMGFDLLGANLMEANLRGADLRYANLFEANLGGADLVGSNLREANLVQAYLAETNLTGADLTGADLTGVSLILAYLNEANLSEVNLTNAYLGDTDFAESLCDNTIFGNVNLSGAKGLETVLHDGTSTIGIDTLFKSRGKIPDKFLRGCGVPENVIASIPALIAGKIIKFGDVPNDAQNQIRDTKAKEDYEPKSQPDVPVISPTAPLTRNKVFISYSHKDKQWLEKLTDILHPFMRQERINIWDDRQIKPGTKWKIEIQEALATAKAAILLVSTDFLRSDFITNEELPPLLKAAEEEGLKILWILVSPCLWEQSTVAQYQALHDTARPIDSYRAEAKRKEKLVEVGREIMKAMNSA